MNNSREKFEEALNNCILETQCLLEYDEFTTRDIAHFIWQAATEQSRKEIAEKDARIYSLENCISDLEVYKDALQAREKVLVEALQNLVEDISKTHGNYTYEQAWINADKTLANERGEL